MDDWTVVVPGPGRISATARALLALANRPEDVMSQAGGTEFRIPPYLAAKYNAPTEVSRPRRRTRKEGDE